jgi:hypothetical protein
MLSFHEIAYFAQRTYKLSVPGLCVCIPNNQGLTMMMMIWLLWLKQEEIMSKLSIYFGADYVSRLQK